LEVGGARRVARISELTAELAKVREELRLEKDKSQKYVELKENVKEVLNRCSPKPEKDVGQNLQESEDELYSLFPSPKRKRSTTFEIEGIDFV
jgi:hypothetical protein